MTDDSHPDREDAESARSLPLLDTFAALEAELAAKEARIERLESELAQGYLDPDNGQHTDVGDGLTDDSTEPEPTEAESEPRTHEDWEPATDPLTDSGIGSADADHAGVTPSAGTASGEPDTQTAEPTDHDGLQPVRTASSRPTESRENERRAEQSPTREPTDDGEFGLTVETSTDLTGGSLGSSTDERFVVEASESSEGSSDSDDAATTRPDPTADRGERLSLLVRRAERHDEDAIIEAFVEGIESLDEVTREMLAHYRTAGEAAPVDAHVAAGGSGERQYAYARNRTLRTAGVVEHSGAGRYRYALPELVAEAFGSEVDDRTLADAVDAIEAETGLD